MLTQRRADFIMVIVVLFWGLSYVLTRYGLDDLGVFNFMAIRMGVGFLIAAVLCFKSIMKMNKETLAAGAVLGALLFLTVTATNFGLLRTSISNTVFLVSMTAVFVPLFSTIIYRKLPERKIIVGTIGAAIGILLLTLTGMAGLGFGDALCLAGAAVYAVHIITAKKFVENKKINALNLGIIQLGFTALYAGAGSFLFEAPIIPEAQNIWFVIFFLAIFSIAFGCVAQIVVQKYTSASHVGLIFALEPIFGSFFAFMVYGEILLPLQILGAAFVFLSVVWIELDVKELKNWKIKRKKRSGV
ncbi:MAG: DMT family transporter [Methanosarcinales archaeon]|jgi:drug/metabolite transporter (DMT)-like permease|nr:DMT family transporter [Methanosarcinales archaeon]